MTEVAADIQGFTHVRIVIGLVTGLSVTRLLSGLSRFVQHPAENRIYLPHLGWTIFVLIYVIYFWWFQYALFRTPRWEFQEYLFILGYAALMYFISTLLYPDKLDGYSGFEDYFQSRKRWFYGLLALLFLVDMADTALKGAEHFASLGHAYTARLLVSFILCIVAMNVRSQAFHICVVSAVFLAQIWWIFSRNELL